MFQMRKYVTSNATVEGHWYLSPRGNGRKKELTLVKHSIQLAKQAFLAWFLIDKKQNFFFHMSLLCSLGIYRDCRQEHREIMKEGKEDATFSTHAASKLVSLKPQNIFAPWNITNDFKAKIDLVFTKIASTSRECTSALISPSHEKDLPIFSQENQDLGNQDWKSPTQIGTGTGICKIKRVGREMIAQFWSGNSIPTPPLPRPPPPPTTTPLEV